MHQGKWRFTPARDMGLSAMRRELKRTKAWLDDVRKKYPDNSYKHEIQRISDLTDEIARREQAMKSRGNG